MTDETQEPEAVETPPVSEETAEETENPLFSALYEAADAEDEEEVVVEEAPRIPTSLTDTMDQIEQLPEGETGAPPQETVVEATDTTVAEPRKKKPKKVKQVVDPDVPTAVQQQVAFQQPEEDPNHHIVANLLPEEKEYYDLAKFATRTMGTHDNLDNEFLEYFDESKAYVEKRLEEDPDVNLAEDDEYMSFIQRKRPNFSAQDAQKTKDEMLVAKAETRALEKMKPEVMRLRREQELARIKPQAHQKKVEFRALSQHIIPEEIRTKLAEGGEAAVAELAKDNPMEYQVMEQVSTNLLHIGDTFVDVTTGAVTYDANNNVHSQLLAWVAEEQDNFIKSGDTKKEGKTFMRRERYHQLPAEQQNQYFTWSDEDMLAIMAVRAKQQLEYLIKYQREMLAKSGYTRSGQPVTQQQPVQQPVQQAPVVTPSPRQGGAEQAQAPGQVTPLTVLGM